MKTLKRVALSVGLIGVLPSFAAAADGTWTNDASSVWSATGNWLNGVPAGGVGAVADFSTADITADRTVTLDSALSVGTLMFGDAGTADHDWTLNASGGSVLTLNTGASTVPEIFVSNQTATFALGLSGTNGLAKTGAGALVWSNNAAAFSGSGLQVRGGSLSLTNATYSTTAQPGDSIGKNAGDAAALNIMGASVIQRTQGSFLIGENAGSTGVVHMSGGTFNNAGFTYIGNAGFGVFVQTGGQINSNGEFDPGGNASSAYGYYEMDGGGLTLNNWLQPARFGLGLICQNKGTIAVTNGGFGLVISDCNSATGVVYQAGGTLTVPLVALAWAAGARGELTVAGTAQLTDTGVLRLNNANGTSIVNLLGGTLRTTQVLKNATGGLGLLSFNGGTLQAGASGALVGTSGHMLDAAYVYGGGAVIDSQAFNVSSAQSFLAPGGYGVSGIDLGAPSLGGYLGAPYVAVCGGSGTGATAVALFDYLQGAVTGIVVTCAGAGFQADDTVTATLIGGGPTNTVLNGVSLAANTAAVSRTRDGHADAHGANRTAAIPSSTRRTAGDRRRGPPFGTFLSLNGGVGRDRGPSPARWARAGPPISNGPPTRRLLSQRRAADGERQRRHRRTDVGASVGSQLVGPLKFGSLNANARRCSRTESI